MAKPISVKRFLQTVDISALLDEDETPAAFMQMRKRQDPEMRTYVSCWGGRRAWFIDDSGFEYIFVES